MNATDSGSATSTHPSSSEDAPEVPTVTSSARRWRRLYLVAALGIGLAAAMIRPPLAGIDEFKHFTRTVTISNGLVLPPTNDSIAPNYRLRKCDALLMTGLYIIFRQIRESHGSDRGHFGDQLSGFACSEDMSHRVSAAKSRAPAADINPPTVYLPAAIGYRVGQHFGGLLQAVFTARLLQLIASVAVTWLALRALPRGHALFACLALLPTVAQINGTISADPISNALVLLWLALALRAIDDTASTGTPPDRRHIAILAAAALGVAVSKPFLAPMLLIVFAIPHTKGRLRHHIGRLAAMIGPAIGFLAVWQVWIASRIHITSSQGADSVLAGRQILDHPVGFLFAAMRGLTDPTNLHTALDQVVDFGIRVSGPSNTVVLATMVVGCIAAIVLAWWSTRGSGPFAIRRSWQRLGVVAGIIVVQLLVIQYGLAVSFERPGAHSIAGLQGRYLIPLIALAYVGTRPRVGPPRRAGELAAAGAIGLLLIANLWGLIHVYTAFYV